MGFLFPNEIQETEPKAYFIRTHLVTVNEKKIPN